MAEAGVELVDLGSCYRRRAGGGVLGGRLGFFNPLTSDPGTIRGGDAWPLVMWSGWLGEEASSRTGEVEANFGNWSGAGRRRLDEVMAGWFAGGGAEMLWIRPHHRHVLSDGPSCASFVRGHAGLAAAGRLGLLLDLDLLIGGEMAARREDHGLRLIETARAMGEGVAALAMRPEEWEGDLGCGAAELDGSVVRLERIGQ